MKLNFIIQPYNNSYETNETKLNKIKSNNKTIQSKIMPVAPGSRIKNSIVIRPCYLGTFRTVLLGAIINSKVGTKLNISCILAVVYSQTDTVRPLQHSHYQTVLTAGAAIDTVILISNLRPTKSQSLHIQS